MVQILENIISPQEVQSLLNFHYSNHDCAHSGITGRCKYPALDQDYWPRDLVYDICSRLFGESWKLKEAVFSEHTMPEKYLGPHIDSSESKEEHMQAIIPLFTQGLSATVFFDNYWMGIPTARFSKIDPNPFLIRIMSLNGPVMVDVSNLLEQCLSTPNEVTQFYVDEEFIHTLKQTIKLIKRSKDPNPIVRAYDDIVGYDPTNIFDQNIHAHWLSHIPIENVHGLKVDKIVTWSVGSAIVFPNSQIHCPTPTHEKKISLILL